MQDVFGFRLEFIGRAAQRARRLGVEHRRYDLLRGRDLRDHRTEARVEQRADFEFEIVETRDDLFRDHLGVLETQRPCRAQVDHFDDLFLVKSLELIVALAADAEELDLLAVLHQRVGALAGEPHDGGIERAAKAAFGRADQKQMHAVAAGAA